MHANAKTTGWFKRVAELLQAILGSTKVKGVPEASQERQLLRLTSGGVTQEELEIAAEEVKQAEKNVANLENRMGKELVPTARALPDPPDLGGWCLSVVSVSS